MKLSRPAMLVILAALFFAAIAARMVTTDRLDSPYYKGASAMAYRHAMAVADGVSLLAPDAKAGHPEGFVPARYRAAGAETITGLAFRVARYFSDIDGRQFTRRMLVVVAALGVFASFVVARSLWDCQAAGLLAAFLTALLPSLVTATNGRTFSHTVFAALFALVHAVLALRALRTRSRTAAAGAALASFLLLWVWEAAGFWIALWLVPVALSGRLDRATRAWFVAAHALVFVAGAALLPHLAAMRMIGNWTSAVVLGAAAASFLPARRIGGWRAAAVLAGTAAFLTLAMAPLRAGAAEQFPAMSWVATRLRFAFGRPDASLLSDWMRHLWSLDHAPPAPYAMALTFLPVGLCALALALNRRARALEPRFAIAAALALAAGAAAALDRSALPVAAPVMIVAVAGCMRAISSGMRLRAPLVGVAMLAVLAGVVAGGSAADPAYLLAKAGGNALRDPHGFVWVSLENTDRELVRFMSTRTSVRESVLAPEDLSALLVAFTGRTVVQLPGTTSRAPAQKHARLARALYQDEAALYDLCRETGVDYVVYSIDVLLDSGDYSPRYLAGVHAFDPGAAAVKMHFDPASLEHFTLLYENDHYRLFQVTDRAQPVFLTDHPPFYHADVFERAGRNVEEFRSRVVYLMLTYGGALDARAAGDAETARRGLAFCVEQAPRFTRARIALAEVLMDMNRGEDARAHLAAVIAYAPDNPRALYDAAYLEIQAGRPEQAKPYLTLLTTQTGDREMIERGRVLEARIAQGLPVPPGAPRLP